MKCRVAPAFRLGRQAFRWTKVAKKKRERENLCVCVEKEKIFQTSNIFKKEWSLDITHLCDNFVFFHHQENLVVKWSFSCRTKLSLLFLTLMPIQLSFSSLSALMVDALIPGVPCNVAVHVACPLLSIPPNASNRLSVCLNVREIIGGVKGMEEKDVIGHSQVGPSSALVAQVQEQKPISCGWVSDGETELRMAPWIMWS